MNKKSTLRSVANDYLTHPMEKNGITLIALVITIIVLLILAGVTIATLTGDNGILTKAQNAKTQNDKATIKEKVDLAIAASLDETGKINLDQLKTNLNNINGLKDTLTDISFPLEVTVDGVRVTIKKDSNGEYITEVETNYSGNPSDGKITAKQIAANPKAYYGKKVENYKASEEDTNTYRIFYVDTENYFGDGENTIYLKADDSYAYNNKTYNLNSYASYDTANTKIRTMNPLWAAGKKSTSDTKIRGESEFEEQSDGTKKVTWNINEQAAAYLCSPINATTYGTTTLPWKSYYKPNDANVNYVIGGPSIEMYVKSYNQTHDKDSDGNNVLECQYQINRVPGYGYKVYGTTTLNGGWSTEVDTLDYSNTYNSMYCGKTTNGIGSKTSHWWISSPSTYFSDSICVLSGDYAGLYYDGYNLEGGICPLVSLKSSFTVQVNQ